MTQLNSDSLQRFTDAHRLNYDTAVAEIKRGKKKSHWMWYIFPQIIGLASGETAMYYAIKNMEEAVAYLRHPILGAALIEICNTLYNLESNNATEIFGYPDDIKLKSSLTLFAAVTGTDPVFERLLQKFFAGKKDEKTISIIGP